MKIYGIPGIECEMAGTGRVRLRGFAGGRAYHIGLWAGLGSFDIRRLFFTLPPHLPHRPKPYVIGPIDTQFAADNRWLPPRIDCLVDGVFFFSFWCRAPSLAELLNDPQTKAALPPIQGLKDVNADDGFGPRRFRFFGEGAVIVPRDGMTVELAFTGEGGLPELEKLSVWPDSRYERLLCLELPPARAPFPRLFLHGKSGETGRKIFSERSPELFGAFTQLLEAKLNQAPETMPGRNADGLEHWDEQDRTACYAFGYALLARPEYYEAARRGVEASLALTHWGMEAAEQDKEGRSGAHSNLHWDNDMCQGVTRILAMILFYDWCHDRIEPDLRECIERKLLHHGELIFRFSLAGLGSWPSFPFNDHNTGTMYALQLIGFVLGDRYEQAAFWLRWGRIYFEDWRESGLFDTHSYYSPQRFNPIAGYIYHTRVLLGEDLARPSDKPSALALKRLIACLSGRPDWVVHDLYGCDAQFFYALASLYRDGHAQWLAENISRRPIKGWIKTQGFRKALELIYRDPTVASVAPDDLPRHFHDDEVESFWYRESWDSLTMEKAPEEVIIVLENSRGMSGTNLKDTHTPRYIWGPAPFRGHFALTRGQSAYLSKPLSGYVNRTRNANCLTVDGQGQISDGAWFPAGVAPSKLSRMETPKVRMVDTPDGIRRIYSVRLDLSSAYNSALNLKWMRTLAILEKPLPGNRGRFERLEIVDEVASDRPRELVFYCHSQSPIEVFEQTAIFKGAAGNLNMTLTADATPLGLELAPTEYVSTYIADLGAEPRHLAIRPRRPVAEIRLTWSLSFALPARV